MLQVDERIPIDVVLLAEWKQFVYTLKSIFRVELGASHGFRAGKQALLEGIGERFCLRRDKDSAISLKTLKSKFKL